LLSLSAREVWAEPLPTGAVARLVHEASFGALAISPDCKKAASTGNYRLLRVWDLAGSRELWSQSFGELQIKAIAFSPDGRTVAAGTSTQAADNVVRLFDAATGKELRRFGKPGPETFVVTFSPDGKHLAAGGLSTVIDVWEVATGRTVRQIDHETSGVIAMRFSPDSSRLAAIDSDGRIRLWDAATGREMPGLDTQVHDFGLAFAPDGRALVSYGADGGQVWDLATRKVLCKLGKGEQTAAVSPDGRRIASVGRFGKLFLWEAATGSKLGEFSGHAVSADDLVFSPDGTRLLSACVDRTLLVWDMRALLDRKAAVEPVRTTAELEGLWEVLGQPDARQANRALVSLVASPKLFLPHVRDRLWSASYRAEIERSIHELDAEEFDAREQAAASLQKRNDLAEPALRRALAAAPSAEAKRRIRELLDRFDSAASALEGARAVRLVEVLEEIGSAEARELLERAAHDFAASKLGREAKSALARLNAR
jgi:WD40 repeat protein